MSCSGRSILLFLRRPTSKVAGSSIGPSLKEIGEIADLTEDVRRCDNLAEPPDELQEQVEVFRE